MLFINLVITLICFWVILKINARYIHPAKWNKYRFKLFELRDRLAILAMKGELKEDSVEYTTLIKMLNNAISETKKLQAVNFLRFLYEIKTNKEFQAKIELILKKVDSDHEGYKCILHEYFETMHIIFQAQTSLIYKTVPHLIVVCGFFRILSNITTTLKSKLDVVNTINDDIEERKAQTLCPACM